MISISCPAHGRLEFTKGEVGAPEDLATLPWVKEGVARLTPTRLGVEMRLGPNIGRLVVPERAVIDVREPFPGTVAACLELTASGRRAGEQGSPPGRVVVPPWSALATSFTRELSDYVMHGIERSYSPEIISTPRPRGRIELSLTATRLISRGRIDKIMCRPRLLSDDTSLNRVISAAASRAEQLLLREGSDHSLRDIRAAAMALSGVRKDVIPDFAAAWHMIDQTRADHRRLLSFAELLVRGVPALPPSERLDVVHPMTAWLNVERLFEEAIRSIALQVIGTRGRVYAGRGDRVTLFQHRSGDDPEPLTKSADPDIVIRHSHGTLLLDAKYRRHEADFTDDELYQLMAHAGAYQASTAALVAPARPGLDPTERWIGRDRNGIAYYLISVDPTSPDRMYQSLANWLNHQLMLL